MLKVLRRLYSTVKDFVFVMVSANIYFLPKLYKIIVIPFKLVKYKIERIVSNCCHVKKILSSVTAEE